MAISAARESSVSLFVWLILGGGFFVDATVTFLSRLVRWERVFEAHRTHAYQHLSRRWGSHRRVTTLLIVINTLWLLPCAFLAKTYPSWAGWIAIAALVPLVVIAYLAGAGRPASDISQKTA
jgi:Fuc2NAc and GlcNAc transferase